ncbi:MAG: hypothetical protein LBG21_07065 [Campylobacteraceae bacterium]|jgi:hypothetical protein|nr:hypothetical protein [Campylobacteraceae bacterium]
MIYILEHGYLQSKKIGNNPLSIIMGETDVKIQSPIYFRHQTYIKNKDTA